MYVRLREKKVNKFSIFSRGKEITLSCRRQLQLILVVSRSSVNVYFLHKHVVQTMSQWNLSLPCCTKLYIRMFYTCFIIRHICGCIQIDPTPALYNPGAISLIFIISAVGRGVRLYKRYLDMQTVNKLYQHVTKCIRPSLFVYSSS